MKNYGEIIFQLVIRYVLFVLFCMWILKIPIFFFRVPNHRKGHKNLISKILVPIFVTIAPSKRLNQLLSAYVR